MTTPDPCLTALASAFPGYTWRRRTYRGVPTYTGTLPDGWALVRVREDRDGAWKATLRMRNISLRHDFGPTAVKAVAYARMSWREDVLAGLRDLEAAAGGGAS